MCHWRGWTKSQIHAIPIIATPMKLAHAAIAVAGPMFSSFVRSVGAQEEVVVKRVGDGVYADGNLICTLKISYIPVEIDLSDFSNESWHSLKLSFPAGTTHLESTKPGHSTWTFELTDHPGTHSLSVTNSNAGHLTGYSLPGVLVTFPPAYCRTR
ncbi:uncharacterized protein L969DRAFT_89294 [Mixia osmundae IAM 14324]|uniref:uncharacterized protein n=1 Tax=Mixia osmundae (strain CBS 9802 / IAM 14324 / JCM 22182 / KY 12970) TaxID=764103 RepID=UPI0004A54A22|nr:uncharacterized protein L969DRAFT_89294 [Mixia osmundae IAM 14324]KEI38035.1 hypothetical protein L969DRAFT_89294 [Mixia osmundae IAM 14324]